MSEEFPSCLCLFCSELTWGYNELSMLKVLYLKSVFGNIVIIADVCWIFSRMLEMSNAAVADRNSRYMCLKACFWSEKTSGYRPKAITLLTFVWWLFRPLNFPKKHFQNGREKNHAQLDGSIWKFMWGLFLRVPFRGCFRGKAKGRPPFLWTRPCAVLIVLLN